MITEKAIYSAWKKRINYPSSSYESAAKLFFESVSKIESVSQKTIQKEILKHQLVVIGDDALVINQTQKMLELLSKSSGKRAFVTNRFLQKHQKDINHFILNRLSLDNLTKKMNLTWLLEENFKKIFLELKKRKIEIIAIGSRVEKANDLKFLAMTTLVNDYDQIFFWTGHLRLSNATFQKIQNTTDAVFLYLQSNELHWRFIRKTSWQRVKPKTYVFLNNSSLISLDCYSASQDYVDRMVDVPKVETEMSDLQKKISTVMKDRRKLKKPNISHIFNLRSLKKLNQFKKNKTLLSFIEIRILAGESLTLPKEKTILLSTLRRSHLAEEIAHYMRMFARANYEFGRHSIVLEEALAFFASLLISPNREIPESKKKLSGWDQVHQDGYRLGFRLWENWKQSKKMRDIIRHLWCVQPKDDKESEVILKYLEAM